jgi:hypothetical protein
MRQVVAQDDMRAGHAIQEALGITVALPFVGVVVTEGERLVTAFVFNNFDKINVDLSITSPGRLHVSAIREIARYVFVGLRVRRVTCTTLATNHRAINSLSRLGFEFEGTLRDRFPGGDGLVFGLLASEQKFVRIAGERPERP